MNRTPGCPALRTGACTCTCIYCTTARLHSAAQLSLQWLSLLPSVGVSEDEVVGECHRLGGAELQYHQQLNRLTALSHMTSIRELYHQQCTIRGSWHHYLYVYWAVCVWGIQLFTYNTNTHTVEPLYKGHAETMEIVLYTEVSSIQRLNYTCKY